MHYVRRLVTRLYTALKSVFSSGPLALLAFIPDTIIRRVRGHGVNSRCEPVYIVISDDEDDVRVADEEGSVYGEKDNDDEISREVESLLWEEQETSMTGEEKRRKAERFRKRFDMQTRGKTFIAFKDPLSVGDHYYPAIKAQVLLFSHNPADPMGIFRNFARAEETNADPLNLFVNEKPQIAPMLPVLTERASHVIRDDDLRLMDDLYQEAESHNIVMKGVLAVARSVLYNIKKRSKVIDDQREAAEIKNRRPNMGNVLSNAATYGKICYARAKENCTGFLLNPMSGITVSNFIDQFSKDGRVAFHATQDRSIAEDASDRGISTAIAPFINATCRIQETLAEGLPWVLNNEYDTLHPTLRSLLQPAKDGGSNFTITIRNRQDPDKIMTTFKMPHITSICGHSYRDALKPDESGNVCVKVFGGVSAPIVTPAAKQVDHTYYSDAYAYQKVYLDAKISQELYEKEKAAGIDTLCYKYDEMVQRAGIPESMPLVPSIALWCRCGDPTKMELIRRQLFSGTLATARVRNDAKDRDFYMVREASKLLSKMKIPSTYQLDAQSGITKARSKTALYEHRDT